MSLSQPPGGRIPCVREHGMQICMCFSSCCIMRRGRLSYKSCGKVVKRLKGAKSHTFPLRRLHEPVMRFFQTFASASVKRDTGRCRCSPGLRRCRRDYLCHCRAMRHCPSEQVNKMPLTTKLFSDWFYLRDVARKLAEICQQLHQALERYERTPLPDRTVRYRADVFESVVCPSTIIQFYSRSVDVSRMSRIRWRNGPGKAGFAC